MTDNEITREKTFSEELSYFKERMKEVYDYYDNPKGCAEMLYIDVLCVSNRVVRKAEEEIIRQQTEIEKLNEEIQITKDAYTMLQTKNEIIKSEAIKECLAKVKNYIKTHCNPYGKPDFEYDTSIKILNFIDTFVKAMVGDKE